MTTYEHLTIAGFEPQQSLLIRKIVTVKELGVKYTLEVLQDCPSTVFQVDGNIIKQGRRCDKLILVRTNNTLPEEWAQIFVELKGHDAAHGVEQLLETVKNGIFASNTNKVRKARLVATAAIPSNRANPTIEKMKRDFHKLGVDFKTLKPNQKDTL